MPIPRPDAQTRSQRIRLLPLVGLVLVFGCATAGTLPSEQAQLVVTRDALAQTGSFYLWPDRLDQRMVIGALDAVEQSFDSVIFDSEEGSAEGVLTVNGASARVPLDPSFDPERYREREWRPEGGETNPFLHLSMHLAIEEQLSIDQPPGIASRFSALLSRFGDRHEALHQALECLAETVWRAQRDKAPPDAKKYLECLDRAARTD